MRFVRVGLVDGLDCKKSWGRELFIIEISVNELLGDSILFEGDLVEEYVGDMWQV